MKKAKKIIIFALISVLIYLLGISIGVAVICFVPQKVENDTFQYFVKQRALEYSVTGDISNWSYSGLAVIVYDSAGKFYDFKRMDSDLFSISFVLETENQINEVLASKESVSFYPLVKNNSSFRYASRLCVGVPVELKDGTTGALFWIREMPDLPAILLSYIISFSAIYIIALIVVLISLNIQDRYARLQKQYIDNITHELKTPVASVKALTEALSDGMIEGEDNRNIYYGMILQETNQQQKMIQEALTLSKLQTRGIAINKVSIPSEELFKPLCEKYETLCDLMGVEFDVHLEIFTLPNVYTDKDQATQVLSALLDNAIKYAPEEGGKVTLSVARSYASATICVGDNGPGIERSELNNIFERFYRSKRNDNVSGSGLGLAIARETAHALHEHVWAESTPGVGTNMYFTLSLTGERNLYRRIKH